MEPYSQWMDLHEIWYLRISQKNVENIILLKSDKGNGYFTSRAILPRVRNVADKSCRENRNTVNVQQMLSAKHAV
jgi:hypothetical protein